LNRLYGQAFVSKTLQAFSDATVNGAAVSCPYLISVHTLLRMSGVHEAATARQFGKGDAYSATSMLCARHLEDLRQSKVEMNFLLCPKTRRFIHSFIHPFFLSLPKLLCLALCIYIRCDCTSFLFRNNRVLMKCCFNKMESFHVSKRCERLLTCPEPREMDCQGHYVAKTRTLNQMVALTN
jgi:hypothetical protein